MFKGLKQFWVDGSVKGWHFPFAFDPRTQKPSITLLFPYITFVLSVISVIALHFKPTLIIATTTTLVFWAVSVVFYMLRKLSKAKFDLDDKSFELESGEKK